MILIFIIAISLSMDAFSLALAYGTTNISKREIKLLSTVVGLYHFFMPIFGMLLGNFLLKFIHIGEKILVLLIFSIIGINMILESKKDSEIKKLRFKEMLLFGLAVSIDSFSIGIGINSISKNYLLCSSTFSLVSFLFTYVGLLLGKKINKLFGKISILIGGTVLILFGILYFINA